MIFLQTNCVKNFSKAWTDPITVLERDRVFRKYQGWPSLPFSFIGFVLTVLYIFSVLKAMREHRVSRKFYALLLNRAFGDALTCCAAFAILAYIQAVEHVSSNVVQVVQTIFTASFWTAMVSYVSLGLLKLYGIARPLHYRNQVTMKRCVQLIVLSWIVFIIMIFMTLSVTALVKVSALAKWSGCSVETCLHNMYSIRNTFTIVVYLFTIICFLVTATFIRRARKNASSFYENRKDNRESVKAVHRRFRFPLIKLALNVSTFAVFHFPYTVWAASLVMLNGCFYLQNFNLMQTLMGFLRMCLLSRIIIDCLISFATDKEIKKSLLLILGCHSAISPTSSSNSRRSTVQQSDLSLGEISMDSVNALPSEGPTTKEESFPNTFSRISFVDVKPPSAIDNFKEKKRATSAKEQGSVGSSNSILKKSKAVEKGPQRSETVKSVE
uniref:G-protein coupled receptors family 1 profile domain-containing protein n=1 Tax=Ditylenchus dipsaci TaxID=166011 RepID=A0A915CQ22_9BILA